MFLQRTAFALARRTPVRAVAARPFSSSVIRSNKAKYAVEKDGKILSFEEIKTEEDLVPPGAKAGTVPSDIEQATGLERLELVGKMQGIDIFDMRPLDASRKGTLENPIIVNGAGDEQYAGCTGFPADSHTVNWLTVSRDRPIERCGECGNVVKLNYVGPLEDAHDPLQFPLLTQSLQTITATATATPLPRSPRLSPTTSSLSTGTEEL
ncbi:unnamed protein product [Aspergillus oryzae RIB40]|uniref:Cytochrome c oxidase subunit 4, mitochondrial n=2 Tax=Aspergillus oryzae TaxID=5062 RepID=Q2UEE5_ASPOR|nr:unnamed protein product [Aspergillus oryzae RIB40]EIT82024.1 cytochrome c oxidase, subunit Vb/COX4 [Aspergillus oryzae 3.042]KDE79585.1 cytochrome c oxidase [Aspergillus oryzae 100-8]BAE60070.1 unnamed protein product [Aspergillus oryzae RIB40]|eukprot:EIT82024.1 cytochrome c oxidase, subunit Vb/COX4 [Aspergillus oryzae 3.042]